MCLKPHSYSFRSTLETSSNYWLQEAILVKQDKLWSNKIAIYPCLSQNMLVMLTISIVAVYVRLMVSRFPSVMLRLTSNSMQNISLALNSNDSDSFLNLYQGLHQVMWLH